MKINIKINSKKLSVGFIGAGNMGLPMIKNLIKAGFNVKVFDWNIKVTKKLDKEKIIAVNNLRAIAKSDFIISMLPNTTDVESVFNNETGINQFLKSRNHSYRYEHNFFNFFNADWKNFTKKTN